MPNSDLIKFKENYLNNGTAYIEHANSPFNEAQINKLFKICEDVEKEFITVGDADEPNHVYVGRFMTDIKKPEIVKNKFSKELIDTLWTDKMKTFVKSVVNTKDELYLRRIQYNEIFQDCFVGYHLDIDSNPDYLAACVIQFGSDFDGGLYRVYNKENKKKYIDYKANFGSLLISDCQFPHEVTKVTRGKRGSLVFFVSKENGLNKRNI